MKKILVLGATGNVGSYFTKYAFEYFRGDEYQIVASGKRPIANVFKTMGIEYRQTLQNRRISKNFQPKMFMLWCCLQL